ncbi:hypothetical protein PCANC_12074 [Puccinia coronata f. sp. avenae]|uniref:Uncharacterized protein n=1 Tax=Puccinia coronata f. sp. avenae TaxID=200324 RepID=A0A2N5V4C4_9BASI|nr:hypothetical protein PCANC_12074 [Puccinia coronata f. sp. avenae]PLW44825.1 hypothetical protein PCASD_07113 [Puccinia coronata f. sp. avenae]
MCARLAPAPPGTKTRVTQWDTAPGRALTAPAIGAPPEGPGYPPTSGVSWVLPWYYPSGMTLSGSTKSVPEKYPTGIGYTRGGPTSHLTSNLNSEIRDYLNANVEASQTDVLEYWRIKTLIYPSGPRW